MAKKQVFGSEAKLAGKGCQTLAFVRWRICLFLSFNQAVNYHRSGFLGLHTTIGICCVPALRFRVRFKIQRFAPLLFPTIPFQMWAACNICPVELTPTPF